MSSLCGAKEVSFAAEVFDCESEQLSLCCEIAMRWKIYSSLDIVLALNQEQAAERQLTVQHKSILSDYPAPEILDNLKKNVIINIPDTNPAPPTVHGHSWGELTDDFSVQNKGRFTRVLAAGAFAFPFPSRFSDSDSNRLLLDATPSHESAHIHAALPLARSFQSHIRYSWLSHRSCESGRFL